MSMIIIFVMLFTCILIQRLLDMPYESQEEHSFSGINKLHNKIHKVSSCVFEAISIVAVIAFAIALLALFLG